MGKTFGTYLALGGFLAAFGALAWVTRHPGAPVLDRIEAWPAVGRLVHAVRAPYLAGATTGEEGEEGPSEIAFELVVPEPRPYIWIRDPAVLRREPSAGAPVVRRIHAIARVPVLERRGDWYRIRFVKDIGWVFLEGREEGVEEPLLGSAPEPVRPLPAAAPDARLLGAARALLAGPEAFRRLGPYAAYTDVRNVGLIEELDLAAAAVEALYSRRTGLRPRGEAREVIVLFASRAAYERFRQRQGIVGPVSGHASSARGLVAFAAEGRSFAAVRHTMLHELTHLLNRRALGPALPPWLDEGLAEATAWNVAAGAGPGPQPGLREAMELAGERLAAGRLDRFETLVALGGEDFRGGVYPAARYAESGLWTAYLLDGEARLRAGFRAFLADVASGAPTTGAGLLRHLGREPDALDAGFRSWIGQRGGGAASE